jgi:hypothetical protein
MQAWHKLAPFPDVLPSWNGSKHDIDLWLCQMPPTISTISYGTASAGTSMR